MSDTNRQKDVFLSGEANAWFWRNRTATARRNLPHDSPMLRQLVKLPLEPNMKVLEIGCGDGHQIAWLKTEKGMDVAGLEPSDEAVRAAKAQGLNVLQGTADMLPFDSASFDIVIFGFCLYLCDRDHLFKIAAEADRVLRSTGWLGIQDFYREGYGAREYHHRSGLMSYKMDYSSMFSWHPHYTTFLSDMRHHSTTDFTDESENWVKVSILRRAER